MIERYRELATSDPQKIEFWSWETLTETSRPVNLYPANQGSYLTSTKTNSWPIFQPVLQEVSGT